MKLLELFNLDELRIDNNRGWGAVPYNQNVDYMGLRVLMKPSMFLKLAHRLDTAYSAGDIEKHLRSDGAIASPFLMIAIPQDWFEGDMTMPAEVYGHEGRNRMTAAIRVEGDNPVETHLFFGSGLRNRDLKPDIVSRLNRNIISQEGQLIKGPWFMLGDAMISEDDTEAKLENLIKNVKSCFDQRQTYDAIDWMTEGGWNLQDSEQLRKLFFDNMDQIAKHILQELHADAEPWIMEIEVRNLLKIGVPLPNPALSKALLDNRPWVIRKLHNIYREGDLTKLMELIGVLKSIGMDIDMSKMVEDISKDEILRHLLRSMRDGKTDLVNNLIDAVRSSGHDWPEFRAMEKSISAIKGLNEDERTNELGEVLSDVTEAFRSGAPFDAIETMEDNDLTVDSSPAFKALFDANMGKIAKMVIGEVLSDFDPMFAHTLARIREMLENIGIKIPNRTITEKFYWSQTKLEEILSGIAGDGDITAAVLGAKELSEWGLEIRIEDIMDVEDNKDEIIKNMLRDMKKGKYSVVKQTLEVLKDEMIEWPELDAIEKSLEATTRS